MILDSNIIIYAADPSGVMLRELIAQESPVVSAISYVEVLGFHNLRPYEKSFLTEFFQTAELLPLDQRVLDKAVALRQQRRMALGDALIAATALVHQKTLITRNTSDFNWVPGLRILDPFETGLHNEAEDR